MTLLDSSAIVKDMIRQALEPDRYGVIDNAAFQPPGRAGDLPFDHTDHCINNVRQALMCNADVTPNVVQYNKAAKKNWAQLDVVHTVTRLPISRCTTSHPLCLQCKDFDQIQAWAQENFLENPDKHDHSHAVRHGRAVIADGA